MISVGVEMAKRSFFDAEKVMKAMDRAERKALSRAGAFVRTRARSSIRRRKRPSEPGTPPSDHGGALKRLLFFAYDEASRSVVVGPALFGGGRSAGQSPPAPAVEEFGGTVNVTSRKGKKLALRYPPRPFMGPALMAEVAAGTIPEQFRGSLGG